MGMRIKKDDEVLILTGIDRGTTGKVISVLPDRKKVIVEGVNRVYKHVRPNNRNPQGGRLSKEMPVDVSNVMLICPVCQQSTRVGYRYLEDGSKERWCKKCEASLGKTAPARAAYAEVETEES